jgi:hypothetical protein
VPYIWVLLLPELPEELAVLGGLAIIILCLYLARGIASGIGGGGLVGTISSWLANSVVIPIANGISHYVGEAVAGPDKAVGTGLHTLARAIDWTAGTFAAIGAFSVSIARMVGDAVGIGELHNLEKRLRGLIRSAETGLTHELGRALHALRHLVHSTAQGVYPRLRTLEHDVTKVIPKEVTNLWKRTKAIDDSIIKLWRKVDSLPTTADITTAVGLAIGALGVVGLNLIRCPESATAFKNWGCSLWSRLENLLPLAFLLAFAFDFPEFVQAATIVADGIGDAVASIEGTLDLTLDPLPAPQT